VLLDAAGERVEMSRARMRRECRPGDERLPCRGDGCVDIAFVPSVTRAISWVFAGLTTLNVCPGSVHAPPMKCPKTRSYFPNQASASLSLSGAGPYSIVSKISATVDMEEGYWLLAIGHWLLAIGYWLLAYYE